MTRDIFDNTILCSNCGDNVKMQPVQINKNSFLMRAVICPKCGDKIIHPHDQAEYDRFINLKGRVFRVKLRLVGNSYAVSIPKEIVSFMKEQEKILDNMVKLCFEQGNKLSLLFGESENGKE